MIHRLINLVELEPDRYKRLAMMREIQTLIHQLEHINHKEVAA